MANGQGHINGAMLFSILYLGLLACLFSANQITSYLAIWEVVLYAIGMFLVGIMFGLWPDVDINSKGQKLFYSIFLVADIAFILLRDFQAAAYLGLFSILPTISKHRGWTHTTWAMLVIPSPLFFLPLMLNPERWISGLLFYGAAVTGYFSHLFFDGLIIKFKKKRKRKPVQE